MKKLLGLLFILFSLATFAYGFARYIDQRLQTADENILQLWREDLQNMERQLPPSWQQIQKVKINFSDRDTQAYFRKLRVGHIQTQADGAYILEVTITPVDRQGFIFQHNMIHRPTGEMLWELNRNYTTKQ